MSVPTTALAPAATLSPGVSPGEEETGGLRGGGLRGGDAQPSRFRRLLVALTQRYYDVENLLDWSRRRRAQVLLRKNAYYRYAEENFGENIASAHFILNMRGSFRYAGQTAWFRSDSKGKFSWDFVNHKDSALEEVDLSHSAVNQIGVANLVGNPLRSLSLRGCREVDDWALARLHVFQDTLEELDISCCPHITVGGLAALRNLKLSSPGLILILLEEMLPCCQVTGLDLSLTEAGENREEDKARLLDFLRNLFSSTLGLSSAEKVLDELTLEGVARYIQSGTCKAIVCMVGAGISTSAGIPDFRSPGTGLYANLLKYDLPYPEAIFQIDYFKKHPEPFFALARELYPGQFKPTVCHYFMRMLKDKGLLRRCYSQNIDTLERVAGLQGDDLIEAHGTFFTSHCVSFSCRKEYNLDWMKDIVFFGESLPDFPQCDLLIVMGTSLQVQPFAGLVGRVSKSCPRLLINMEKAGEADPVLGVLGFGGGMDFDSDKAYRDVAHISTCDEGCLTLADLLGWKEQTGEDQGAAVCTPTPPPQAEKEDGHGMKSWRTPNTGGHPLLTTLGQLRACRAAWGPKAPWDRDAAHTALLGKPPGSFLVLEDSSSQPNLLCVCAGAEHEGGVLDYYINYTCSVLQLSGSRLCFSDLAQLVLFYSLTRDVLSSCLFIPPWLLSLTTQSTPLASQLHPESWFCEPPDLQADPTAHPLPRAVMCSIQLTSVNGALYVINPLYLHHHGDPGLTRPPPDRRDRRLSTSRPWAGAGLHTKRAISLEDKSFFPPAQDNLGLFRAQSAQSAPTSPDPPASGAVVLRRPSVDSASFWPRGAASSPPPSVPSFSDPAAGPSPGAERRHSGSPHRVSWVEDGLWLAPPPPPGHSFPSLLPSLLPPPPGHSFPSLLPPPLPSASGGEQDTLSSSASQLSAHRLADKVMNRLSAVGQAIGGLVSHQKRLVNRVMELSDRKGGAFAEALRGFLETTPKGGMDPDGPRGTEFLQEVRSSLTALREVLLDRPEIQAVLDGMGDTPESEIESTVELSLHKVALKPVSAHLYASLQAARHHDGTLAALLGHRRALEDQGPEDLGGSAGTGVPDAPSLERVLRRWGRMHSAYSPSRKVQTLLKVCKSIYHSMNANALPGVVHGADDFLPCVTWVLLRSDLVTVQLDTDYMMELLDPSQLRGEGGYYLTSVYASLYYISSFRPRLVARQLSVEAQLSLDQWHRRRTLHCDQSRRSKHRRTLRRQLPRERDGDPEEGPRERDGDPEEGPGRGTGTQRGPPGEGRGPRRGPAGEGRGPRRGPPGEPADEGH
ncbi:hypothetical protein NHX12_009295 [Muraenolepis orangiensis]|uniref:NAD-dependent protein deacetylase sirtuin-2 n=1 Tax=Muraenolepis orangiensis TaxID=630683 RepID=A0A9Q0DQI9_9TELE|nr:hypothetical protein NHX12_009295 [Muraenolepis orangiensis]